MLKLIAVCMAIVLVLVIAESSLISSMAEIKNITVSSKYTDGDLYLIDTITMERYSTPSNIYNKFEINKTYTVKVFSKTIWEVVDDN
jgi:hypothetical protein